MQAVKFGISVVLLTFSGTQLSLGQDVATPDTSSAVRRTSVQHAVAQSPPNHPDDGRRAVRQVVGKQPESPARRSGNGLLGSIFGGRETSTPNQRTATQGVSNQSSPGLLSRFGGGNRNSEGDEDGRRVIEPAPRTEEPDWTGVPFHSPKNVAAAKNTQPITDPNDPSNRNKSLATKSSSLPSGTAQAKSKPLNSQIPVPPAETAFSNRPKSPAVPAKESRVASRSTSSSSSPSSSAANSNVPSVPRTATPELNTSKYEPLSATDSSRRPRRRTVSPLEVQADEVAANIDSPVSDLPVSSIANSRASTSSNPASFDDGEEPRVSRRTMPQNAAAATPAQTASTRPSTPAAVPPSLSAGDSSASNLVDSSNATTYPDIESNLGAKNTQPAAIAPSVQSQNSSRRNSMPTTLQRTDASYAANSQQNAAPVIPQAPVPNTWKPVTANDANNTASSSNLQPSNLLPSNLQPNNPTVSNSPSVNEPSSNISTKTATDSDLAGATSPLDQIATREPHSTAPAQPQTTSNSHGSTLGVTPTATAPPRQPTETAVAISTDANNIVGEIPGLRVITSGPADIPVRQPVAYKIAIENMSNLDAPGAMVQVKLPAWVAIAGYQPTRGEVGREDDAATRHLLWMVEGLPAGSREEITLNLSATEAKTFDVNTEWAVIPKSSSARVTVREPKLDLIIDGPDQVVFGESQIYKVRVINPGSGPSASVVFTLSPNSATPQSQRIGVIPPGKEAQFEVELTARDLENLQIHGLASGEFNLKAEQIKNIQVVRAQLEAVVTGPPVKYQDAEASYNLQLSNQGMTASKNVTATLRLPMGCQYLGGIEGAQQNGNQLTWSISELPPSETIEYTFACKMSQTGQQKFDFACEGTALGKASIDFITQVDAVADLVLSINDPAAPAPVGKEVVYEIVVRNRGSKVAEQVNVLAQFSADIEPIRIEGAEGEIVPGQVKFVTIPKIDAGQQIVLKVFAKAEKEGHHRFCSEVSCGETLLISEEATRYMEMVGTRITRRSSDSNQE